MAITVPTIGSEIDVVTFGKPVVDEVNRLTTLTGSNVPTAWTNAALQNGWVNLGGIQPNAMYRKVGDIVYCRGRIASGTMGLVMFNLPVGFRPPGITLSFLVGSIVAANWAPGIVEVDNAGDVKAFGPGTNGGQLLNQISFSITA